MCKRAVKRKDSDTDIDTDLTQISGEVLYLGVSPPHEKENSLLGLDL